MRATEGETEYPHIPDWYAWERQQVRAELLEGSYRLDTEGYIRTGIVYYDGPSPVYGVAVGQNLTTTQIDGRQVVEQNNFRAVFTAQKLSFWQDSTEIAYVSNNRLYITNITVLDSITVGPWRMDSGSGLAFKWIGG